MNFMQAFLEWKERPGTPHSASVPSSPARKAGSWRPPVRVRRAPALPRRLETPEVWPGPSEPGIAAHRGWTEGGGCITTRSTAVTQRLTIPREGVTQERKGGGGLTARLPSLLPLPVARCRCGGSVTSPLRPSPWGSVPSGRWSFLGRL